jgi:biopolymer transport protein ExbD
MKITRRKLRVEVPTVAMGDIAFNLLVFFVILARAQDDSHLKWTPAQTKEHLEAISTATARVVVDDRNRVYLNGRQVSVNDLASGIEQLLGDAPLGKRTVLLKIHKDTQAATFEPIVEAVSQAGGELVHVLEEKR